MCHIINGLFLRGRKLNIALVFTLQSDFKMPKTIRLNMVHYFMKIPNKTELQQIASNHSTDIKFKELYTTELLSFLVTDTTLSPDNPLRFMKNIL